MEISYIFSYILFLHYIGDFVFQTRKMGNNKSSSIKWLSIHVLIYTLILLVGVSPLLIEHKTFIIKWVIVNGILHWITDFFTSKISKYFYLKNDLYHFWVIIGLDQLLHAITLMSTFNLLSKL